MTVCIIQMLAAIELVQRAVLSPPQVSGISRRVPCVFLKRTVEIAYTFDTNCVCSLLNGNAISTQQNSGLFHALLHDIVRKA